MKRMRGAKPMALAFGLMAVSLAPAARAGAPDIAFLRYSADTGANLVDANTFVARRDYVEDDLSGKRSRMQIPGLPDNANLHDFHVEPNGQVLFAVDIGVMLGGTYFAPADVIRFNGSTFSKEFDSAAAGVPTGVHCDGVARWGDTGKLLLSFDRTFSVAGIVIRPADVIAYSAGAFGPKILDAQALDLPANLNVDAVDTARTRDYVLVSFDTGGSINGITFTAADIMQLDRHSWTWSKRFAMRSFSDRWDSANLDGLAAVNIDTVFQGDFD
jgi:hypothetical protein